eukprot:Opistho-1_new@3089
MCQRSSRCARGAHYVAIVFSSFAFAMFLGSLAGTPWMSTNVSIYVPGPHGAGDIPFGVKVVATLWTQCVWVVAGPSYFHDCSDSLLEHVDDLESKQKTAAALVVLGLVATLAMTVVCLLLLDPSRPRLRIFFLVLAAFTVACGITAMALGISARNDLNGSVISDVVLDHTDLNEGFIMCVAAWVASATAALVGVCGFARPPSAAESELYRPLRGDALGTSGD